MSLKNTASRKLTRDRAIRLSAIEGMRMSKSLTEKFAKFDADGINANDRRALLIDQFKRR